MSSLYRILCLSHDPAIEASNREYRSTELAEQAIREGIDGHEKCDLMIGRYSYPLVELGCPGNVPGDRQPGVRSCFHHRDTRWISVEWIRLLACAQRQPEGSLLRSATVDVHFACFPPERLHRLRFELGTATPEEIAP